MMRHNQWGSRRQQVKNRNVLILLIILSLALLACGVVRRVAEPIDRQGCQADCRGCEFSRYVYETDDCYCLCDGVEVQLY